MKSFKDSEGTEWVIALNIGAVKRLRDLARVDLTALNEGEPPLITRLTTDIVLVCDVLFVLCKAQADERKITDEGFAARLDGDAIRRAWQALQEELIDFFHQLGRTELAKVIEANQQVVAKQMKTFETKIGELAAVMDRQIEAVANKINLEKLLEDAAEKIPGAPFTSSPASSASTPTP